MKFGVGSGMALGLKSALERFQMNVEDGLFAKVAQKNLFERASAKISRGVV